MMMMMKEQKEFSIKTKLGRGRVILARQCFGQSEMSSIADSCINTNGFHEYQNTNLEEIRI